MRARSLGILAVVTAVAVVAAGVAVMRRPPGAGGTPAAAGLLFSDLAKRINDITRIEVAADDRTVTVARAGQGPWLVAQKDNYPADVDAVKRLAVALAGIEAVEPRTALPELHARIGVEGVGPGRPTVRVVVSGPDEVALADLLVGKTASAGQGGGDTTVYVRKPDEARSWLARAPLGALDAEPLRWLDRRMPRIARDRVKAVEIHQPDGTAVVLSRSDPLSPDFAVAGLPEGARPATALVEETVGAFAYVSYEDVRSADAALFADTPTAIVRTFDGVVLTVRTAVQDHSNWLALAASFDPEQARDGADAANPALLPADAAQAQAREWQERYSGWAYKVFDGTADRLRRPPAGFVRGEG